MKQITKKALAFVGAAITLVALAALIGVLAAVTVRAFNAVTP